MTSAGSPTDDLSPRGAVLHLLEAAPIVPILTVVDVEHALSLAEALYEGGVRVIEITLRTPLGLPAIERIASRTQLVVAAGTVLSTTALHESVTAGARIAISPGFNADVVALGLARGILPIPGIATASELDLALRSGITHVKLFPAAQVGGVDFIRAVAAPFPTARFMPSGGVNPDNIATYLSVPEVFALSGSWMIPGETDEYSFAEVARAANRALKIATDHGGRTS